MFLICFLWVSYCFLYVPYVSLICFLYLSYICPNIKFSSPFVTQFGSSLKYFIIPLKLTASNGAPAIFNKKCFEDKSLENILPFRQRLMNNNINGITEGMQKFCRLLAPVGAMNALAPLDLGRIKIQLFEKLENRKLCLEGKNKVLKSRKNFTDINIFRTSADFY